MNKILCIESATNRGSVALVQDGDCIHSIEISDGTKVTAMLGAACQDLLSESNLTMNEIDAVAISIGPGSYTGLRVAVSLAKGICFSLNIPLIAINTLHILASAATEAHTDFDFYLPMIDARRMEVYTTLLSRSLVEIMPTQAVVIDSYFLDKMTEKGRICCIGNGVEKCLSLMESNDNLFDGTFAPLHAMHMAKIAQEKWINREFQDVATLTPLYLKDFLVGPSSKKIDGILGLKN